MATDRTCAVPGCNAPIHRKNRSGVCRAHNHTDSCVCVQCKRKRGEAVPATKPQPERPPRAESTLAKRTVHVVYPTGNSTVAGLAPVSMPVMPWDGE